jgi:uncharacterized protein
VTTPSTSDFPPPERRLLAPLWHTAGLFAILLLSFLGGIALQRRAGAGPGLAPEHRGVIGVYISAIVLDALLFSYVWVFASKNGTRLAEIVGERWNGLRGIILDVAVAAPFWVVWELTAQLVHRLLGPSSAKTVDVLLPRTPLEILVWIGVSVTAGFCEEAVFRGYLQKQLLALTGSAAIAVSVQAILFGIAHGYQGFKNVVVITVLGALYGVLALWRRSPRPGMIAHAWSDVYGGLQLGFLSRVF